MKQWKLSGEAPRAAVERALAVHESLPDWPGDIVLGGVEIDAARWRLEAWLPREPAETERAAIAGLFDEEGPELVAECLPDADWVTLSQQAAPPIRAGRFRVRTPDHPAAGEAGIVEFTIPAGRAFGTGHHETTAGCLAMLDTMRARGVVVRNFADVGTGTGVLAFAALALWPRALGLASDIDPVSIEVTVENARDNAVRLGDGPGRLVPRVADGMADPLIAARVPYDLVIANILAGPLIEMMPDFARSCAPGGQLLLAGLMTGQEAAVRRAALRAGFRLAQRAIDGDWSILWLRRRALR